MSDYFGTLCIKRLQNSVDKYLLKVNNKDLRTTSPDGILMFSLFWTSIWLTDTRKPNCPKLCGNYAFPQNFHSRKLGKITLFYAVGVNFEHDFVLCNLKNSVAK